VPVAADVRRLKLDREWRAYGNQSLLTSAATMKTEYAAPPVVVGKDLDSVWVWFYKEVAPLALLKWKNLPHACM